jgi:hypothetical protein
MPNLLIRDIPKKFMLRWNGWPSGAGNRCSNIWQAN